MSHLAEMNINILLNSTQEFVPHSKIVDKKKSPCLSWHYTHCWILIGALELHTNSDSPTKMGNKSNEIYRS